MRDKIVGYRQRYGDNWLTIFENGIEIPWRLLSLDEFLKINDLKSSGRLTTVEIEDEIFRLVVLEPIYIENLDILPAGVISVVSAQVYAFSGPQSAEEIQNDLNIARSVVQDFMSSAMTVICSVFPGYTPETLLSLTYETFMKRLALSEKRLLELGFIKEPIQVMSRDDLPLADKKQAAPTQSREKPSDIRKRELLEARKKEIEGKLKDLNGADTKETTGTVISRRQMSEILETDTGHDLQDKGLWQHDAIQGLEFVYSEYFKMMKEGKKITPEVIQDTKGRTNKEVEEAHEKYVKKVISGEINPTPSKFFVADKMEVKQKETSKVKAKIKRR